MGVAKMTAIHPMFSVVMCCNRDDGFLFKAIESVLEQSYSDFEFVIVLNRCTDQLYESVVAIDDLRIVLLRTEIGQLSFNLNVGVNAAKGKYIVRFDADDVCHVDRLKKTCELIEENPDLDMLAGSCRLIDEAGTIIGSRILQSEDWRRKLKYINPFIHPAMVIKRDLILANKGYLGGYQSEDYDLWIRLSKVEGLKCVFTGFPMIDYRISAFQSKGSRLAYSEVASYFFREFLIRPDLQSFIGLFLTSLKAFFRSKK